MAGGMEQLIQRLELLVAPSRAADADIWLTVTPGATREQWSYVHKASGQTCHIDETREATGRLVIVPSYTESLNDALTLLPSRRCWHVAFLRSRAGSLQAKPFSATVDLFTDTPPPSPAPMAVSGDGGTPALALTIACLKARHAQA